MRKYFKITLGLIILFILIDLTIAFNKPTKFFELSIFEYPANQALKNYPELQNCRIQFISTGKRKIAHQAIPKFSSLLLPRKFRIYQIKIAEDQYGVLDSTIYKNLENKSRIGVLGHELAHVLDYTDESSISLIKKGVEYLTSEDYRIEYERSTNCIAIKRNLKEEIKSWSKETHKYLQSDGRGKYYHSPNEIDKGIDCD